MSSLIRVVFEAMFSPLFCIVLIHYFSKFFVQDGLGILLRTEEEVLCVLLYCCLLCQSVCNFVTFYPVWLGIQEIEVWYAALHSALVISWLWLFISCKFFELLRFCFLLRVFTAV